MSKKPVNRKQTTQTKKQPAREQQTGRRQAGKQQAGQQTGRRRSGKQQAGQQTGRRQAGKQQAGQQSGKQQSGKKKQRKGEERTATANLNIGTFIYIMIAIYLFVSLVLYLTAPHITSYQVKSGPLSQNEVYTAIALREEQVVNSSGSGYISYFTGDSSKVAKNGPICCVSDNREMFSSAMIDKNNIASEHNLISKFAKAYNSNDFGSTYNLKYALRQSTLYSSQGDVMIAGMQLASQDGVVAYTTDGYEYVTAESLTAEEFRPKTYSRQNLQTDDKIVAGTPLYRLITSDTWSICIPVTQKQSARLEEYAGKVLKVRFLKDGQTERGEFSLEENGNQRFAKLTFYSGMIRYCDDRYLEVELITNIETGLKIPVSSLVQKEFYLVPELYRYSDENGTAGFTHCYPDKNGTEVSEFISPVCYEDKQIPEGSGKYYYFLDKESVSEGDVMIKPDSQERYTIGVTEKLQGVYCINKGYTVFRKVEIIDQNEEYAIVKSGTRYGIEQFDFIVRDSSTVKESDILYR